MNLCSILTGAGYLARGKTRKMATLQQRGSCQGQADFVPIGADRSEGKTGIAPDRRSRGAIEAAQAWRVTA